MKGPKPTTIAEHIIFYTLCTIVSSVALLLLAAIGYSMFTKKCYKAELPILGTVEYTDYKIPTDVCQRQKGQSNE